MIRLDRPRLAGALTLLVGLLASGAMALWKAHINAVEAGAAFDELAAGVVRRVTDRLRIYEYGLRGARGVVASATGPVTRDSFRRYSQSRDQSEFPGAHGFGLIWRVAESDEARFVDDARRDEWPNFSIRQLAPHTGERFVIQYIEPVERNRAAVGLDIASERNRREAALAAARTGAATLTEPITLVQATGQPARAFLLLLPIYRQGSNPQTAADREAATIGWSYAPLVIDEVLDGLAADTGLHTLSLRDSGAPDGRAFFSLPSAAAAAAASPDLHRRLPIQIYGRAWEADVRATPAFVSSLGQTSPARVAAMTALVGLLCAALATVLAQLGVRARNQRIEQARRASIVSASDDAIVGATLDGVVTDWNAGAERLFGYTAAEAVGRRVADLIVPEESASEESSIRDTVRRGERLVPFEALRRHRSGELIDVSISAAPIIAESGECIGYSKSVRDIRDSRRDRQRLAALNASLEDQVAERTALLDATMHDLRAVLDAVPSMIGYWDRNLVNRMANRAYATWFDTDPATLPGRTMRELLGDDIFEKSRPFVEGALRGEPQTFERAIPYPDGSGRLRHSLAHYLPDIVDGEVRGFYVLVHDVSDLVASRQSLAIALRDNEALLSTLQQHFLVSVADRSGRIVDVNAAFCAISGYSREELIGQDHRIVNSGHHGRDFWIDMWRTVASGRSWHRELCNRAKDGSTYWVSSIVAPFLGHDGRVEKYISIRTDITARKLAEAELSRTMTLLRSVLDASTQVSIIAVEPDGMISLFNRGAELMLGYSAAEVIGRERSLRFHDREEMRQRAQALTQRLGRTVHTGRALVEPEVLDQPNEWTYLHRDGRRIPVSLAVTAMRDDHGELVGYLGVAHDVSERMKQEASLRHALNKAQTASLAKSEFLANMSHEIRTPMNAVIGLSYLLERTRLDTDQQDLLGKIKGASQSLLSIINDVLDLSKIEAAEMQIERAPFALEGLLQELASMCRLQADAKGVALEIDLPTDLPQAVEGDATRLRQVLTNLLSNAIKFTERGRVQLSVRRLDDNADHAALEFEVVDSGIGIPEDVLPKLFSPFVQADTTTTRRFGGTGLGLSIVKQLVTLMRGSVGVDSTPGVGSRFWVKLDLPVCDTGAAARFAPPPAASSEPSLVGVRVLVADDSGINLELARRVLEIEGARVVLANNGKEAVDQLLVEPHGVDVVLMDVQMPVLDGHDATRRIRSGLGLTQLPIIALTAGITTGEYERARAAGMNDVVAKPFDPSELIRVIRKHVRPGEPTLVSMAAPDKPPLAWPTIEGIDGDDVRARLGGDVSLYRSLLRRLIEDFSELGAFAGDSEPTALAARMHYLKGSAGTLGAKALERLAAQAESACLAGAASVGPLLQDLSAELDALRTAAAAALREEEPWEEPEGEFDAAALSTLVGQLRSFDLEALKGFRSLAPHLQNLLGADTFVLVRQQVENLKFAEACRALEALEALDR